MALLSVQDLTVAFGFGSNRMTAVKDVSFNVDSGEIVGLVGESGSGKSTIGLALMGLLDSRSSRTSGQATLHQDSLLGLHGEAQRRIRGSEISMIFQEPMTALDPVFTIGSQIVETLRSHGDMTKKQAWDDAVELLKSVGIADPHGRMSVYPHQMSGGMRQRVMIAIALACGPKLIIADEPTTAVDVTIQAQLLELVQKLSNDHGTSVLFITHDLGVVAEICSRMIIMYQGEIVEEGLVNDILINPRHPYTAGLLAAIPRASNRGKRLTAIPMSKAELAGDFSGCPFSPRCAYVQQSCLEIKPELITRADGRSDRCLRADELQLEGALV